MKTIANHGKRLFVLCFSAWLYASTCQAGATSSLYTAKYNNHSVTYEAKLGIGSTRKIFLDGKEVAEDTKYTPIPGGETIRLNIDGKEALIIINSGLFTTDVKLVIDGTDIEMVQRY